MGLFSELVEAVVGGAVKLVFSDEAWSDITQRFGDPGGDMQANRDLGESRTEQGSE